MKELLTEIFETYHMDVYTYLYSLCRDASLAEDLTSEVFLDVVKSIGSFRGASDIKTWLFTIARRRWIDHLRKKNREIRTESIHDLYESALPGTAAPAGERELVRMVEKLLKTLPLQTQKVVSMRLDGYSYFEIAAKCGISESSARVIFFRTKAKLKEILEKEGYSS